MSKIIKPLSVAVGVAFVGSLAISQAATASSFNQIGRASCRERV